jgi:hypothetical protein
MKPDGWNIERRQMNTELQLEESSRFFEYDMAAAIQAGYERKFMHALKFG